MTPEDAPRPPIFSTRGLPAEAVEWGFRLLAGRAPVDGGEFANFQSLPDLDAMRRAFTNLPEFHGFFSAVLTGYPAYAMPLFLLRPPATPELPWVFQAPTLDRPVSQLCTAAQFEESAFLEIIQAMALRPARNRQLWEQAWVVSMLATEGLVARGKSGLALESGRERIGALLASRGVAVLGTGGEIADDRDAEARRLRLFYPEIVHIDDFDSLVSYVELNPREARRMPPGNHDFCWSLGIPARLGSIEAALDFFEASLAALRPGGLALHTFSFNLTSDAATWELPDLVVLRRRDIEALAARLAPAGHQIMTFNTHPGHDTADETVKTEPHGPIGHRQRHGFAVVTSFGLAIRKAS
ncbi:hypothetical protein [Falsiroseomonas sp.]|uniref:hypothetical protein n=1 Tax=Falsiroseomonas sp. TaxID=2870721 RepID=UPI0034A5BACF